MSLAARSTRYPGGRMSLFKYLLALATHAFDPSMLRAVRRMMQAGAVQLTWGPDRHRPPRQDRRVVQGSGPCRGIREPATAALVALEHDNSRSA